MIKLEKVSKTYQMGDIPTHALKNIDLDIKSKEIFGVIGPSGAGKSTLIRCVNLLERPSNGRVIVDNQNLTTMTNTELRAARRKIGMIFQHFNLLSARTVYDNIALPLELAGEKKTVIQQRVMPLLELTGLADKKQHYPSQLSGGQKQRVAIARALANRPTVLLSDEATSALDPQTTHSILQLLKDINREFGITILLITHEMSVVKEICDRLAIIQHGEIIEQAEVIQFFSRPETETAKQFVRSVLKEHLPDKLQQRILPAKKPGAIPLLQISFLGETASEPFIAKLIQTYGIDINILQAQIETIHGETVGTMIVEPAGEEDKINAGIQYLTSKGINVEVIGYVE